MKQNCSIKKSLLQFHGFIEEGQMKHEAGTNRDGSQCVEVGGVQMKKRKLKDRNEITNKEFVKLLDELWCIDPEEEEALLNESFRMGRRKSVRQEKEKEDE
jgi:hypothetical protein